jgi:hypothetical protein
VIGLNHDETRRRNVLARMRGSALTRRDLILCLQAEEKAKAAAGGKDAKGKAAPKKKK